MESFICWAIVGVLSAVVEVSTSALVSIWFFFGAIAALATAAMGAPFWLQLLVFLVVSGILVFCFLKFWRKNRRKKGHATNLDRMVGKAVLVTEPIDNLHSTGAVRMNGQIWNARTEQDLNNLIPAGVRVVIKSFSGSTCYVEEVQVTAGKGGPNGN